jgi:hypothetical protein
VRILLSVSPENKNTPQTSGKSEMRAKRSLPIIFIIAGGTQIRFISIKQ